MNYPADVGEWTKRRRISVSLDDAEHQRVLELCEKEDRSRSSMVKRLVEYALLQYGRETWQ